MLSSKSYKIHLVKLNNNYFSKFYFSKQKFNKRENFYFQKNSRISFSPKLPGNNKGFQDIEVKWVVSNKCCLE